MTFIRRRSGGVDLQQAAARAGVSWFLIYLAIERGEISYRPLRGRFDEGPSKGPAVS